MGHVRAHLDERARVHEQLDPLARGEAALGVDLRDALGAAARQGLLAAPVELGETLLSVQGLLLGCGYEARARLGRGCVAVKRAARAHAAARGAFWYGRAPTLATKEHP
jgi:hypothetical protein